MADQRMTLARSEVESRRFGLNVHRGRLDGIDARALTAALVDSEVDVAILRLPCEKQPELATLARTGFPFLVADTLVYYRVDLASYEPAPLRNRDLAFAEAGAGDADAMRRLVREIFASYTNHYSANPLLAADLLPGYEEWAAGYATGANPHERAWLVRRGGELIGFATCASKGEVGEGVLYGVVPGASGGGVYGDIVRFTQARHKAEGFRTFEVSTQVQNYAVQKVWSREGFTLRESLLTIHVNSLLQASRRPRASVPLRVSAADVERWGEVSGDRNRLHFDDDFARSAGFEARIAHGLAANGAISRYFGTEYPGEGTAFVGYSYRFFRPMMLEREYRLDLTFPAIDERRGFYKAVAQVRGAGGELCLLAYADLYKKP